MAYVFYIKKGDLEPPVEATLLDPQLEPIDLTTAVAVLFKMGAISAAATIVSATDGTVRYQWQGTDTGTAGKFEAEFEIEWPSSRKQTVPNRSYIQVYITEDVS